jgi:hypothetical protein
MAKKKFKKVKRSSSKRSGGGKFDFQKTLLNPKVIIGSIAGLGFGVAVEAFGKTMIPNIHARNAIKAIVPCAITGIVTKDAPATIAAGASGLAMGLASYATQALGSMAKAPATPAASQTLSGAPVQMVQLPDGTFAAYPPSQISGEDVFSQTNGDFDNVSGDFDNVSGDLEGDFDNVSGDFDNVSGELSGDFDNVSGDLDQI